MIVLDSNVLSDSLRPLPTPRVLKWLRLQSPASIFTTAITEAEIRFGLELLPAGKRRTALKSAIGLIFEKDLSGRVLPFDSAAAREFAILAVGARRAGRPMSQADAQIAAVVRSHGARLATRNTSDFVDCGFDVINPWNA